MKHVPNTILLSFLPMSFKYPENNPDSNIYADEKTSNYYSSRSANLADKYSKTKDLFSNFFVKYLSLESAIQNDSLGRDAFWCVQVWIKGNIL